MKIIEIKATQFFSILKDNETSMWQIFAQMIDGEEKNLVFLNEENKVLFNYILPDNLEKLEQDRQAFSQEFITKLKSN